MEELIPHVVQPIFATRLRPDNSGFVEFGGSDDKLKTGEYTKVLVTNGTDGSWTISEVAFGLSGRLLKTRTTATCCLVSALLIPIS